MPVSEMIRMIRAMPFTILVAALALVLLVSTIAGLLAIVPV